MKTAKRTLSLVLVLAMLVGVFAMSVSAEETPEVSRVEIHFYYNGTELDVDPVVEDLPAGMTTNLATWLEERLYAPGSREPLKVPSGFALQNDVFYWISNDATVKDTDKTVDSSGNPKDCRIYVNVVDAVPDSYTVRFHANHADAEGSMDFLYVPAGDGVVLSACAFTLADYTFTEWNTSPDGTGIDYGNCQVIQVLTNSTVDLYAQWRKGGAEPDPEPVAPNSPSGVYYKSVTVKCSSGHHTACTYDFLVNSKSTITMSPCGTKAYVQLSSEDIASYVKKYNLDTKTEHEFITTATPVVTLKYVSTFRSGYWTVESGAEIPVACGCDQCCGHWQQHTVTYTDGVDHAVIFRDIKYTQKHGEATKVPANPVRRGYKFAGWTPCVSKYVTNCVTYTATWIRTDGPSLAKDHVAYLKGYGGGLVKPEGNITRAEAISILYRLMDEASVKAFYTTTNTFADVSKDAWYNDAVSTLAKAGVLKTTTGLLNPDEAITRAEFFYMLTKFSGATYRGKCIFKDVPANHWAYDELALAHHLGWVKGYGGCTVKPDDTITRAEVAASLNRVLGRTCCTVKDTKNYKDNPTDAWYYRDIVEASIAH